MAGGVTFKAETGPLQAALTRWLQGPGKKAGVRGIKSVAAEVIYETVGGISHGLNGTPERVDTGEYRDGWLTAAKDAGVPTPKYPTEVQGDGRGTLQEEPMIRISLVNEVEHASFVEYGTTRMRPGNSALTSYDS